MEDLDDLVAMIPHPSCKTTLQDGRKVEICTREGAKNAFLRDKTSKNCDFISSTLKKIKKICSKKRLNPSDKGKIPETEIRFWLEYVIDDIKELATKRTWIQSGTLDAVEASSLLCCTNMFQKHAVPVAFAFGEGGFFSILADFVKACKGNGRGLPSNFIAGWILAIVDAAFGISKTRFDNQWSAERAFKKLEASGILAECLRCMTVPQQGFIPWESEGDRIVKALVSCPSVLRKYFKKGDPCGNVVLAILEGKDGHGKIPVKVTKQLQSLVLSLQSIEPAGSDVFAEQYQLSRCGHCGKMTEVPLMTCGRCKSYYYCTKECSFFSFCLFPFVTNPLFFIADWKKHKKSCKPLSEKNKKKEEIAREMVVKFFGKHGERIHSKMIEECQRKGLKTHNMAIELDFMPNNNGIIPALSDDSTSNFKITPIREITNPRRPRTKHPWLSSLDKVPYDEMINHLRANDSGGRKNRKGFFLVLFCYAGGVGSSDIALYE